MSRSEEMTKTGGGDTESGYVAQVGPYSFEWPNEDDFFEGIAGQDLDRTSEPVNKVGRGYREAEDEVK